MTDFATKMRMIDNSVPPPTPEDEARAIRYLERSGHEDLAPMLGLVVPQVTNPESSSDTKVAV